MMRDDLVAWLDGECDEPQANAIEQALEQDAELRTQLAALVRQRLMLAEICARPDSAARSSNRSPSSRRVRASVRLPRRSPSLLWFAAAAGILLAVGVLLLPYASSTTPPGIAVLTTSGDGVVLVDRRGREPLLAGAGIPAGARLEVPALTFAELRFGDGSTLALAGDSAVVVQPDSGERVHLERGSLTAVVTTQPPGTTFVIGTAHGRATVLGTRFTLTVTRSATHLRVDHGRVRLAALGRDGLVIAAEDSATLDGAGMVARLPRPVPTPIPPPARPTIPGAAGSPLLPSDPWVGASVGMDDGRGVPREIISVSGQPFTQALRISTPTDLIADPRHTGEYALRVRMTLTAPISAGDAVLARLWLRSGDGRPAQTRLVVEDPSSQVQSLSAALLATNQWRQIELPFHVLADGQAGTVEAQLWLGRQGQTIEVAGLTLTNHGATTLRALLPQMTYDGRAADAPWRTAAAQRIAEHRLSRVTVRVEDSAGRPLPDATVTVRVRDPALRFGTAVVAERLLGADPDDARFRDELLRRFHIAVPENALKWPERERDPTLSERATAWLSGHGLLVRGHTLVWLRRENLPADLRARSDDPLVIRERLDRHLRETVNAFRGQFSAWDVINDPYSADLLLKGDGRDLLQQWFTTVKELDPTTPRFLNLYGVLDDGGADLRRQEFYERLISDLIAAGAPLDGLGLQCHQGRNLTSPERLNALIERFARFGLPIHITEFDVDLDDDQLQADYTRDALTVFASQPAVTAVLAWGFWAGDHHRPQAAMLRNDWSPKPNAQVWDDSIRESWMTPRGLSDATGRSTLTAWRGTAEISVVHQGRTVTTTVDLRQADTAVTVRLP
ncbi:MAG: endo-1,4-beta-xylanase [Planctomycetes bacterium]|nr:endo-1,4-beta-xylanase [Planctomycetota bacterium]